MNALEAYQIRQATKLVVFDSLDKWFVGAYDTAIVVEADFQVGQSQLNATFNNTSTNATSFFWEFGDGATSVDNNPSHIYSGPGQYTVTLTAYHCDSADTATQTLTFETTPPDTTVDDTATQIRELDHDKVILFPNPAVGKVYVSGMQNHTFERLELIDLCGRNHHTLQIEENQDLSFDIRNMSSGVYIVRLSGKQGDLQRRLFIQ